MIKDTKHLSIKETLHELTARVRAYDRLKHDITELKIALIEKMETADMLKTKHEEYIVNYRPAAVSSKLDAKLLITKLEEWFTNEKLNPSIVKKITSECYKETQTKASVSLKKVKNDF